MVLRNNSQFLLLPRTTSAALPLLLRLRLLLRMLQNRSSNLQTNSDLICGGIQGRRDPKGPFLMRCDEELWCYYVVDYMERRGGGGLWCAACVAWY